MNAIKGLIVGLPIGLILWLILVALYVHAGFFTTWLNDPPEIGTPKEYRYRLGETDLPAYRLDTSDAGERIG